MLSARFAPLLVLAMVCMVSAAPATVGDKAPDFALSTVQGKSVRLSEVISKGPVALVVLRGYPGYQCPFCNRQVQDFLQKSQAFLEAGTHVVMVYPGPPQNLGARATGFLANKNFPANLGLLFASAYAFTNLSLLRWHRPREARYPS